MAMIKCPECGKDISDNACSCPSCGNPMKDYVVTNSEIEEIMKKERVHMAKEMKLERKEYAPLELFCRAHYTNDNNKDISVTFKMNEDRAKEKQLNLNKEIKIKVDNVLRDVIVDSIDAVDNPFELHEEYPYFETKTVEFLWGKETVHRRYKTIPIEITDKEYNALQFELFISQMRSINENIKSATWNVSVIKGIMIFTLIASILAGIISACSVLS